MIGLTRQTFTRKRSPFRRFLSNKYYAAYKKSIQNREKFWEDAAEHLTWYRKWDRTMDNSNPPFTKWFVGGKYSHCYNSIDRHVENGKGEKVAIIHDSPVMRTITRMTYAELLDKVSHLSGALSKLGLAKGDRVMIYMPMVPEAIVSMMAVVRLGAIHAVVFGGFASKELSARISSCRPKVIICASYGVEPNRLVNYKHMVDEAISQSPHKPLKTIVYQRPTMGPVEIDTERDVDWAEAIDKASSHDCVPVESSHPMYLLYTSGTTGLPKAVVRPTAGHSVALHWSMSNVYGLKPGETLWTAADIGWVSGHSYTCHGPLVQGSTTVMYEGKPAGTPDSSSFFRVIDNHKVACMFVSPTALRVIKREDTNGDLGQDFDLSSLRTLFVGGEHCDTDTADWTATAFNTFVLNHWWQTETGHPITAPCVGLDTHLQPPSGTTGLPVPGWDVISGYGLGLEHVNKRRGLKVTGDNIKQARKMNWHVSVGEVDMSVRVVDEDGVGVKPGVLGNIVAKLPLNPGTFSTIWDADERYVDTYFKRYPGYYDTMDAGIQDEEGYISVLSRTDDVINVAGHRLSCGHIEEVICSHYAVIEAAVVGKDEDVKGSIPFAFIAVKQEYERDVDTILNDVVQLVRDKIGPVAAFKQGVFVKRLPKTRSGKIPRRSLEEMVNRKVYKISPTIEDASVYGGIERSLEAYRKTEQ